MSDRYATGTEGESQPGSSGRVLRNVLGIIDPAEMNEAELALLHKLYEAVLEEDFPDRRITVVDFKHWRKLSYPPFREGNGRLSRLLADVMAMQAGHVPLDYSEWDDDKAGYIAAIHAGFAGDYVPMRRHVTQAWRNG